MLLPKLLIGHINMGSAIWFIILAVLSVFLLFYTFWRKKDLKLAVLKFFLSAIAAYFEFVIFLWLQSYEYYPHIVKIPYYDNVLGAYLSQIFYVSTVAVFIAAFNLGFGWMLLFATMFVGIENLFLVLGIYKLNWWHTGYTGVGLFVYFWIGKKWYTFLLQASSRLIRLITLNSMNFTLYAHLIVIPTVAGHFHFAVSWFSNPARNTVAVIIVYCIIRSFIIAMVCFFNLNRAILTSTPILMFISYYILIHLHIFSYKSIGDLIIFSGSDIVILLCCYFFNRVLSQVEK